MTIGFRENNYTVMEGYTAGVCINVTVKGIVNRTVRVNISTADLSTMGRRKFCSTSISNALVILIFIGSGDYTPIDMTLNINNSTNIMCVNTSTVYDSIPMNLDEVFSVSLSSHDPLVFIPKERENTLVIIENSKFSYNIIVMIFKFLYFSSSSRCQAYGEKSDTWNGCYLYSKLFWCECGFSMAA